MAAEELGYNGWFQRGILLRQKEHYDLAITAFQNAIQARPNAADPYVELARCYANSGQARKALKTLDHAQGLAPNSSFIHSLRAWIHCNLASPLLAKVEAEKALRLTPQNVFALQSLGRAYHQLENWQKTRETAERVLKIDPQCTYALNLIASVYQELGRINEAERVTGTVLQLEPHNSWAFANAGYNALARGKQRTAEGHFRESLSLSPRYAYARIGLLRALHARYFPCRIYYWMRFGPIRAHKVLASIIGGVLLMTMLVLIAITSKTGAEHTQALLLFSALIVLAVPFFGILLMGLGGYSAKILDLLFLTDPILSNLITPAMRGQSLGAMSMILVISLAQIEKNGYGWIGVVLLTALPAVLHFAYLKATHQLRGSLDLSQPTDNTQVL